MGSVAFPDAEYKFFLTASVEERAGRWQKDQEKKGNNVSLQQAIEAITQRDYRDTTRAVSPLVVPAHAIIIDSTNLTLDQTVQEMLKYIKPWK
jgi:cytidylate kinase